MRMAGRCMSVQSAVLSLTKRRLNDITDTTSVVGSDTGAAIGSGQAANRLLVLICRKIVCFGVQLIGNAAKLGRQLWLAVCHFAKLFRRHPHERDDVAASLRQVSHAKLPIFEAP
jgi:hypothetical protein